MTLTVQRLAGSERPALLAHLLSLPPADRQLRFGTAVPPGLIAAYVAKLDFTRDALFGVHDQALRLAGLAQVAFEGAHAEGISVQPRHRRRGVAAALLERVAEHARNRGAPTLFMQFLSHNAVVARLARRLGMRIVATGIESRAVLELPQPSMASMVEELLRSTVAGCKGAIHAFRAGWYHRGTVKHQAELC